MSAEVVVSITLNCIFLSSAIDIYFIPQTIPNSGYGRALRTYLTKINPSKVTYNDGYGSYDNWHGDNKSSTRSKYVFQTKTMITSTDPPEYVTIISDKGATRPIYIRYRSYIRGDVETIIDAMRDALSEAGY